MQGGWNHVVAGLPQVHVIIGVHRAAPAFLSGQDFVGPGGDHLIHVHIGGGTGSGLKHIYGKLIRHLPGHDFPADGFNGFSHGFVQQPQVVVCPGCHLLDQRQGFQKRRRQLQPADRKIIHGSLGGSPEISLPRYLNRSK